MSSPFGQGRRSHILEVIDRYARDYPKLRVHFIGGPNKTWSPDAYHYIVTHHPDLWMIEANATYRGWFTGGNQEGDQGNEGFVRAHVAGRGALGDFLATQLEGTIKMGDTPTVARLLRGAPEDPTQGGWGGRYVRAWERPAAAFARGTTRDDEIDLFGILELALPVGADAPAEPAAHLTVSQWRADFLRDFAARLDRTR